jgi:glucose-1-phosphate cytidylyltransferase
MKVVLFCGGLGMRIREYSEEVPKPMVPIGYRPILWHVMRYYAAFGHRQFILCLGYKADVIKNYFLDYDEALSNDFVLSAGGRVRQLMSRDIDDWEITFIDTGLHSCIGERLLAVREHLQGEEMFLANYADGLTDMNLPLMIERFEETPAVAAFAAVRPNYPGHMIEADEDGTVRDIQSFTRANVRMNGGYFVLRRSIFDYLLPGEDLVDQPFQRLIRERKLLAYPYDGFWMAMDTFKDKQQLDQVYSNGEPPWEAWVRSPRVAAAGSAARLPGSLDVLPRVADEASTA